MLDIATAYNTYKFLGHEFLTWLWFLIETDASRINAYVPQLTTLVVGNRMVLENHHHDTVEMLTIKGDDASLEEALLALRKGAMITQLNLVFSSGEQVWRATVKGESLSLAGFKTPATGPIETDDDLEGAVLEKVYLFDAALQFIDRLYTRFLSIRLSETWSRDVVPQMRRWIAG